MHRLCDLQEKFIDLVETQMSDLENVDAEEMGEVIDIIKDLAETKYYCSIVEAMNESSDKSDFMPNNVRSRMYYHNNKKTWDEIRSEIDDMLDEMDSIERDSVKQRMISYVNKM